MTKNSVNNLSFSNWKLKDMKEIYSTLKSAPDKYEGMSDEAIESYSKEYDKTSQKKGAETANKELKITTAAHATLAASSSLANSDKLDAIIKLLLKENSKASSNSKIM